MKWLKRRLAICLSLACAVPLRMSGAESAVLPNFQEVSSLIRSNLTDFSISDLDRAATTGLINELSPRVTRLTNGSPGTSSGSIISKSAVYDGVYGYIRFYQVDSDAIQEFNRVFDSMRSTNKLKGLVLDLRFADGHDYAAAAGVADRFLDSAEPLLKTPEGPIPGTAKTNAVKIPVAALVNKDTAGAAEALAALIRKQEIGLIIGARTSGTASGWEVFPLSNGEKLRISKGTVQFGDGESVALKGLNPDLEVTISAADEKAYYDDPFKMAPKLLAGTTPTSGRATRTPSLRGLNEAELVRRHREGAELEELSAKLDEDRPLINDPALARGLDLLKGLSVAKQFKRH